MISENMGRVLTLSLFLSKPCGAKLTLLNLTWHWIIINYLSPIILDPGKVRYQQHLNLPWSALELWGLFSFLGDCKHTKHSLSVPLRTALCVVRWHRETEHEGILYHCPLCEYNSKSPLRLQHHHQAKHEGMVYLCDKCQYKTRYKRNLNSHMKNFHSGLPPIK